MGILTVNILEVSIAFSENPFIAYIGIILVHKIVSYRGILSNISQTLSTYPFQAYHANIRVYETVFASCYGCPPINAFHQNVYATFILLNNSRDLCILPHFAYMPSLIIVEIHPIMQAFMVSYRALWYILGLLGILLGILIHCWASTINVRIFHAFLDVLALSMNLISSNHCIPYKFHESQTSLK